MHPILFKIGPFVIYSYGTMVAIAFLLSIVLASRRIKSVGLEEDKFLNLSILVIVSSIIGARVLYLIFNPVYYFNHPVEIFLLNRGGLVFYGGLAGGLLCIYLYCRKYRLKFKDFLNFLAPYLAFGQAISRIGCFLDGCCFGRPTASFLGIIFPADSIAGMNFPYETIHPVQLYSAVIDAVIFTVLLSFGKNKFLKDKVFIFYLLLYSAKRFFIEFLRADTPPLFIGLNIFQFISAAVFVVSFCILLYGLRNKFKVES